MTTPSNEVRGPSRLARMRARRSAAGLRRLEVWVPDRLREAVKVAVKRLIDAAGAGSAPTATR